MFLKVFPLSFQLRCVVLCLIMFDRTCFLLNSSYLSPENTCKLWKKWPPVQVCPRKFNKFTSPMLMLMLLWKDLEVSTVLFSQEMPPFYLQVESQPTFSVYFNVVCVKCCFTDTSLLTLWLNAYNIWYLNCKKRYSCYIKIWICIHSLCVLCLCVCGCVCVCTVGCINPKHALLLCPREFDSKMHWKAFLTMLFCQSGQHIKMSYNVHVRLSTKL